MKTIATCLTSIVLAIAAAPAMAKSPGQFIMAGPTNVDTDTETAAIQWRFGFHFAISPDTVSEVRFTCAPIPGTTVTVNVGALKIDEQGNAFALTAPTPMSIEATPWLYEQGTTTAICEAEVTTTKGKKLKEQAPLHFDAPTKAALIFQFGEAFKYNSRLKSRAK